MESVEKMKCGERKMNWDLSYTERACRKLESLCVTRYCDKYPAGFEHAGAYGQMERELSFIERQGSAPLILEACEALAAVDASPKDYFLKGVNGASVVLYIMGLTELEPLSVTPKVYPEFCFGPDGEKKLSIELVVTGRLFEKLVRYFDNYAGEARLRHVHDSKGGLYGVCFSDPQRSVGVYDPMEFRFLFSAVSKPNQFAKRILTGPPFAELRPETFDNIVKCGCWTSFDDGTWEGNGRELYRTGTAKPEDLIANREDVFEYLILHGLDKETAYHIARDISLGNVCGNGWDEETLQILNNAGVPEWYIRSCEKIRGLSSRMHAVTVLTHFGKHAGKGK